MNPNDWYVIDDEHRIHRDDLPAIWKRNPTVTVASVTDDFKVREHVLAVIRTASAIPFRTKQLLVSLNHPEGLRHLLNRGDIQWKGLNQRFNTASDYCEFLLRDLADYIDTDFCLLVHSDGYATNPAAWTNEFLRYDYVGAPFAVPTVLPWFLMKHLVRRRVGNGGFSLRSSRWMKLGKTAPGYTGEPEDCFCCRKGVRHWLRAGCQIAPVELALRFSAESFVPEFPQWHCEDSFGFHGLLPDGRKRYTEKANPWGLLANRISTLAKVKLLGRTWAWSNSKNA